MRPPLLAYIVTLTMLVAVVAMVWRRRSLDRGGRWIARGVTVFLVYAFIAMPLTLLSIRTRLYQEIPLLLGATCYLIGFAYWQPTDRLRLVAQVWAGLYVLGWVIGQFVQGLDADFSYVTMPLHAIMITAAAGFTMVTRVRVSWEPLTRQFWFWACIAMMLIYSTDVLLIPLSVGAYRVRNDLLHIAALTHLAASAVGYVLISAAVARRGSPGRVEVGGMSMGTVRPLL